MNVAVLKPKIVLANWKANLAPAKVRDWCRNFSASYQARRDVEVVVAVPALVMEYVSKEMQGLKGVSLAAQAVSTFPQGNYTGSLPAAWLRDLAKYALIGHRERRRYFHESVQDVARQVYETLSEGIQPIVCVDESLLVAQTAAVTVEELDKVIWAYTPETPKSMEMSRNSTDISDMLARMAPKINRRPVLYGGGLRPENSAAIWAIPGLSGIMLGQQSLDGRDFAHLVAAL